MLPLTWPHRFTYLVYVSRKQLNNYNSFFGIMNHSAIGTLAIDIWLKVVGSHFDASEYLQIPHTKSLYFCRWSACWMIDGTRYWCIWNLNCICSVDFFVGWIPHLFESFDFRVTHWFVRESSFSYFNFIVVVRIILFCWHEIAISPFVMACVEWLVTEGPGTSHFQMSIQIPSGNLT